MFLTDKELDTHIRRRPAVQLICFGVYIQQPIFLTAEILAVPLSASGSDDLATLLGEYISMDLDIHITVNEVEQLKATWKHTAPAVVLVWHAVRDASTEELEKSADRSFSRAKRCLALMSGDRFYAVATIVLHEQSEEYRLTPQKSKRRQRLWLSKEEAMNFQAQLVKLSSYSEENYRLSLALQMYLDAVNEPAEEFRIVKLFNVLECLAAELKGKDEEGRIVGSRDAVRKLLGVVPGQSWQIEHNQINTSYDLIAVAGKFRDVIMHGSRVEHDTFSKKDRGVIEVLAYAPYKIADELHRLVDDYFLKL